MARLIFWAKDNHNECGRALSSVIAWHAKHHEHEYGCGVMWSFHAAFSTHPNNHKVEIYDARAKLSQAAYKWSDWAVPVLTPDGLPPPFRMVSRGMSCFGSGP